MIPDSRQLASAAAVAAYDPGPSEYGQHFLDRSTGQVYLACPEGLVAKSGVRTFTTTAALFSYTIVERDYGALFYDAASAETYIATPSGLQLLGSRKLGGVDAVDVLSLPGRALVVDAWRADRGVQADATNTTDAEYWTGYHSGYVLSQTTDANQPLIAGSGVSSRLTFDGAATYMTNAADAALYGLMLGDDTSYWIWMVAENTDTAAARVWTSWSDVSEADVYVTGISLKADDDHYVDKYVSSSVNATFGAATQGEVVSMCQVASGTSISMFVDNAANGSTEAVDAGEVVAHDTFGLGAHVISTVASWAAGDLYEIVIGAGVLTAADRTALEAYKDIRYASVLG